MSNAQQLGRGRRWWDWRWEQGNPVTRGDYFVLVEEASAVRAEGLTGPGDAHIRVEKMGERPWRFRSCGITTREFLSAAPRVEPFDFERATVADRRSRRAQLLEAFGAASLPLVDIFVEESDEDLPFLRSILTPGSWFWIGVRFRRPRDNRLPVYLGSPEQGADPASPRSLQLLEAVPPFYEYRLRDIFSLAHVRDAGEEEESGGEGAPPPDRPRDGREPEFKLITGVEFQDRRLLSGEA